MAEKMAETAGGQLGWSQMAEGLALRDAVSSTDAVSAIEQAETRRGNDGVPWDGGSNAGGSGQPAIKVVGDVTRRSEEHTSELQSLIRHSYGLFRLRKKKENRKRP